jgi:hypothetical protein
MAYVSNVEVEIELDDFYDSLYDWDKDELVELLIKDGYEMKDPNREYEEDEEEDSNKNLLDHTWNAMIKKIDNSRYQLTPEQEELLFNLAKSL